MESIPGLGSVENVSKMVYQKSNHIGQVNNNNNKQFL